MADQLVATLARVAGAIAARDAAAKLRLEEGAVTDPSRVTITIHGDVVDIDGVGALRRSIVAAHELEAMRRR